jgi:hypothetical protein
LRGFAARLPQAGPVRPNVGHLGAGLVVWNSIGAPLLQLRPGRGDPGGTGWRAARYPACVPARRLFSSVGRNAGDLARVADDPGVIGVHDRVEILPDGDLAVTCAGNSSPGENSSPKTGHTPQFHDRAEFSAPIRVNRRDHDPGMCQPQPPAARPPGSRRPRDYRAPSR